MDQAKIQVLNCRYVHENKVVKATIFADVSLSCVLYLDVYIGTDGRLYVEDFHHENQFGTSPQNVKAMLQIATFLVMFENRIIDLMNKETEG